MTEKTSKNIMAVSPLYEKIRLAEHEHQYLDNIAQRFGTQSRLDLLQEECAELIQSISKDRRYHNDESFESLVEETADVLICIKQMFKCFDYWDIENRVNIRLNRKITEMQKKGI